MTEPAVAVEYRRVSKEEQARGDKTSLAQQAQGNAALAAKLGATIVETFEDPGVSGGSSDRPGFRAMLAYCRAHPQRRRRPGYVLVFNDSRWGRWDNPEVAAHWRVELEECGWIVRFAEHDDITDPSVRVVMRSLYSSQATLYRQQIKANARRGARGSAALGYWLNEAPYGYRRQAIRPDGQTRVLEVGQRKALDERVRLVPGPEAEVQRIRWLFQSYGDYTHSLQQLADLMLAADDARRWSKQQIATMLRNRTYLGEVIWCRRPHDARERHETPVRPESEWVICRDAHQALVTPAVFAAAGRRLSENRARPRAAAGDYPLSGILVCAHCGQGYIGGGGAKGPPEDPDRYRFYKDGGSERMPRCAGRTGTVTRRVIEPAVIALVAELVESRITQRMIARAFDELMEAIDQAAASTATQRGADIGKLGAARDRLVQAIAAGQLDPAEAQPELARIRTALATAAPAEAVRFQARRSATLRAERDRLLALAADFRGQLARVSGAAQRALLAPWIESCVLDKERRVVTLTLRRLPAVAGLGFTVPAGQRAPTRRNHKRLFVQHVVPLPHQHGRRRDPHTGRWAS